MGIKAKIVVKQRKAIIEANPEYREWYLKYWSLKHARHILNVEEHKGMGRKRSLRRKLLERGPHGKAWREYFRH